MCITCTTRFISCFLTLLLQLGGETFETPIGAFLSAGLRAPGQCGVNTPDSQFQLALSTSIILDKNVKYGNKT